jgi:hypothetical protein
MPAISTDRNADLVDPDLLGRDSLQDAVDLGVVLELAELDALTLEFRGCGLHVYILYLSAIACNRSCGRPRSGPVPRGSTSRATPARRACSWEEPTAERSSPWTSASIRSGDLGVSSGTQLVICASSSAWKSYVVNPALLVGEHDRLGAERLSDLGVHEVDRDLGINRLKSEA